jgi:hypothetical protein
MKPCTSFMIELSKWKCGLPSRAGDSAEIVQSRMTSWEYIRWWRGYLLKFSCWVWPAEKQRVRSIQKESPISLVTQLSTIVQLLGGHNCRLLYWLGPLSKTAFAIWLTYRKSSLLVLSWNLLLNYTPYWFSIITMPCTYIMSIYVYVYVYKF